MRKLIQNILLALVWVALTGDMSPANLILGFVLGIVLLWIGQRVVGAENYFTSEAAWSSTGAIITQLVRVLRFLSFFLLEVIVANIDVMLSVLSPRLSYLRPAIIALPLDVDSDNEITLLANMITLTPGTLSLDVSADRRTLYVHCVFVDDPEDKKQELKQSLERLIDEVVD